MKHQRGVAIIIVILIVALATSLSVYVLNQQTLWQRQVEASFDRGQAKRLSLAGLDWARAILADDGRNNNVDHEGELWAKRLPAMPVEGGEILGFIEDRQGLFNLNNLVLNGSSVPAYVAQFQRLLNMLGLPGELALNLADWLDSDNTPQLAGGAEDSYYLSLPRPYRCANRPLTEIGELSLVKGFDASIIKQLRPYVSVLPSPTTINVNFSPAEVLAAVIEKLPLSDARAIVLQRHNNPFKSIDEFKSRLPNGGRDISVTDLSVSSQYFWVTGKTKVGNAQITAQALLQRTSTWPRVLWQNIQ
ncbi:MAG TPA: type II secretion system minor pseudopilin GspK [Gallionellaceae bacterium]